MVKKVKSEKCNAKEEFQNIRALKDLCLGNFSVCKKAEDASIGLIHAWYKWEGIILVNDINIQSWEDNPGYQPYHSCYFCNFSYNNRDRSIDRNYIVILFVPREPDEL